MAERIIATNELVTGPPGTEMLHRALEGDTTTQLYVLDNACGGGIITAELLRLVEAKQSSFKIERIVAADIDPNMIDYVKRRQAEARWYNVDIVRADQQALSLPDNTFSYVLNNFGIFFCVNEKGALAETLRILSPGGKEAFTTWKGIAWWPSLAVPALLKHLPNAPSLPEPLTIFPAQGWNNTASVSTKLQDAGFKDVAVLEYSFTPDVPAEEFAEATAALTKGMARRFWSEEDNQRYADGIQPAFLRYLLENFPDGKWNGQMTSIISIGKKA